MKTTLITLSLLSLMMACGTKQSKMNYPVTQKVDTVDTYFNTQVPDPYRWLEDDNSDATKAWVIAQNQLTESYLGSIAARSKIQERLTQLWDYPKEGVPVKKAGRYIYSKNDGLQNQSVLYVKDTQGDERVLIDPNSLSAEGTISLAGTGISKNGQYLAYMLTEAGSDWNKAYVMDIGTGKQLTDELQWLKFSGLSWYKDGFFYSRYDQPKKGTALTSKNEFHKIYYHKLGDPQEKDQLIFVDKEHPLRNCSASVTEDEHFLVVSQSESTSGNIVYIKDLQKNGSFEKLNDNFDAEWGLVGSNGNQLFFLTNYNAPNYHLLSVDASKISLADAKKLLPEQKDVLTNVNYVGGKLFASYLKDAHSQINIFTLEGQDAGTLQLPTLGTCSAIVGNPEDAEAFFAFTSFTFPTVIYRYNVLQNTYVEHFKPKIAFDFDQYETKQVFYKSKDGTDVPMFLVHKKGLRLDGTNPTLLYGYGGFNISLTPSFSVSRLVWLENGGVYAMANLRGGGEYGEAWHKAGTKMQKQHVFDDFIAAAEYLIKEKYTSPKKLAIQGGSNGGLLIGATVNQRPDLFGAAIPQVGVMDMLRYQKFTIGWAWASDYGTSDDSEEQFKYLYAYSPLHTISDKVDYPAIMVMTADHDDRVVPAHSFKYAATLQEKQKDRANPMLIRIQTKAGHGAGRSTATAIEEATDTYAFLFKALGVMN